MNNTEYTIIQADGCISVWYHENSFWLITGKLLLDRLHLMFPHQYFHQGDLMMSLAYWLNEVDVYPQGRYYIDIPFADTVKDTDNRVLAIRHLVDSLGGSFVDYEQ